MRRGFSQKLIHMPERVRPRHWTSRDQSLGFSIGHDVRDLAFLIEDVDRHDDHAQLQARQEQVDELHAIVEIDSEAVAGPQPAVGHDAGQSITAAIEIAKRFGGEESGNFVNGVLDAVHRGLQKAAGPGAR